MQDLFGAALAVAAFTQRLAGMTVHVGMQNSRLKLVRLELKIFGRFQ